MLGQAVNVLLVVLSYVVSLYANICGSFEIGREFVLMVDGDEMCFRLGENGSRVTSHLIDVFDKSRHGCFHYVALVVLQQVFKSPSFLGDAQMRGLTTLALLHFMHL